MKLVYTSYIGDNKNRSDTFCGFRNEKDFLNSLLLSSTISSKNFDECELYTDTDTIHLIENDGRKFPFDKIYNVYDELNGKLHIDNWAYPKLLTYKAQDKPFLHIDTDAILFNGLPPKLRTGRFICQHIELLNDPAYSFYNPTYLEAYLLKILPANITYKPDYAMNMAIFGINDIKDLHIVKEYVDTAEEYVKNQQKDYTQIKHRENQCILYEQLFIVNILSKYNILPLKGLYPLLNSQAGPIYYNPTTKIGYGYTHLIRNWKVKEEVVEKIKNKLNSLGFLA